MSESLVKRSDGALVLQQSRFHPLFLDLLATLRQPVSVALLSFTLQLPALMLELPTLNGCLFTLRRRCFALFFQLDLLHAHPGGISVQIFGRI